MEITIISIPLIKLIRFPLTGILNCLIMKKTRLISSILLITILGGCMILQISCRKNLLDQQPTTELPANAFWKTEADAVSGLMGLYAAARPCFDRDYYFDG